MLEPRAQFRHALDVARRKVAHRDVNLTPEFMGFGNQLYLWCWAYERRFDPVEPKVLINERTRMWLREVPTFAEQFLIEREQVRILDRRGDYWANKAQISGYRQGFSPQARRDFIAGGLLPEPLLAGVAASPRDDRTLTIVVRRGDFYAPGNRSWYAFDARSYVHLAVAASIRRDGPVARIHVISDDIDWCRGHLVDLSRYGRVTYPEPGAGPADHFRQMCRARRLIITNGTFCLWGAFISRTLHHQDPGMIWAPAFFQSTYEDGRCFECDQDFSFIDQLPGGWQPKWILDGLDQPATE